MSEKRGAILWISADRLFALIGELQENIVIDNRVIDKSGIELVGTSYDAIRDMIGFKMSGHDFDKVMEGHRYPYAELRLVDVESD